MKIKTASNRHGVPVELGTQETQIPIPSPPATLSFKLQKILVPVDFSDCSKRALQYAVAFARHFEAELTLLHVIQPYPLVPEMGPVDVEALPDRKTDLEGLRQTIGDTVRSTAALRIGTPQMEIVQAARTLGVDLIIIATHGHKGFTRLLLGSTAEKVVRHAPCPVLIVRETEREFLLGPGSHDNA